MVPVSEDHGEALHAFVPNTHGDSYASEIEHKDIEVFVKCPETSRTYSIGVHAFAQILEKNGTPLEAARPQKRSPQQIDELVKRFCNARDLSFMKTGKFLAFSFHGSSSYSHFRA